MVVISETALGSILKVYCLPFELVISLVYTSFLWTKRLIFSEGLNVFASLWSFPFVSLGLCIIGQGTFKGTKRAGVTPIMIRTKRKDEKN